jgi:DNA (cytosine-5)-methyltransferase 1
MNSFTDSLPARRYRVLSLFSGAMGLDLGLDKTGRFELVGCVEVEKAFCDTIRTNVEKGGLPRSLVVFERDIATLSVEEVLDRLRLQPGDIDVLVGGPPCQTFSTAGRRRTVEDPRGTLLWQFLRFVEGIQPKFFLMENVRGLLSAALRHRPLIGRPAKGGPPLQADEEPGSVVRLFAEDLQRLQPLPYHMDCFEVNAVNYGAPQLRERALFIGNRFNTAVDFPEPTHGNPVDSPAGDLFDVEKRILPWQTLGDAIGDLASPGNVIMDFSPRKKRYLSMVSAGSNWRSLPVSVQKESMGEAWHAKGGRSGWWRRLSFDLPCPTLVTMPNHASTALCHPTEVRALTLREYARIQGFSDNWSFRGKPSQQYAQVGNAVPVCLGSIAGYVIADALDRLAHRRWRPCTAILPPYRVIYVQSHVRTRQWFKGGLTFVWDDGECNEDVRYTAPVTRRRTRAMA